eukprot:372357-Prymnesium_polylepis.1
MRHEGKKAPTKKNPPHRHAPRPLCLRRFDASQKPGFSLGRATAVTRRLNKFVASWDASTPLGCMIT